MATYYEFKKMIGKIFGSQDILDTKDDIIISSYMQQYGRTESNETFIILNEEIENLYNSISQYSFENVEMSTSYSYEVALGFEHLMMIRDKCPITLNDTTNNIDYVFGYPSMEYCVCLIIAMADKMSDERNRYNRIRSLFNSAGSLVFDEEEGIVNLHETLPQIARNYTLRISTNKNETVKMFRELKTSFVFQFMYRTGYSLTEFSSVEDMIHRFRGVRTNKNIDKLDMPPMRKYVADVIDYYKVALSATDPYIQFLSYYHVMEYFYDEVFEKKVIEDVREKITNPGFSYNDDKAIFGLVKTIRKLYRNNDEEGQGNELDSLNYVLMEYVPIDELKAALDEENSYAIKYYQSQKVMFCGADEIPWTDSSSVYKKIAQRIYMVRNSLVHSKNDKSDKGQNRYRPYEDEFELQNEILLVKTVAELIIIHSSQKI